MAPATPTQPRSPVKRGGRRWDSPELAPAAQDHGRPAERRGRRRAGAAPAPAPAPAPARGTRPPRAAPARAQPLGAAGRRALPHRLHLLVLTLRPSSRLSPPVLLFASPGPAIVVCPHGPASVLTLPAHSRAPAQLAPRTLRRVEEVQGWGPWSTIWSLAPPNTLNLFTSHLVPKPPQTFGLAAAPQLQPSGFWVSLPCH